MGEADTILCPYCGTAFRFDPGLTPLEASPPDSYLRSKALPERLRLRRIMVRNNDIVRWKKFYDALFVAMDGGAALPTGDRAGLAILDALPASQCPDRTRQRRRKTPRTESM